MRIIEITNSIRIPITNEESDLLGMFAESEVIEKTKLSERERHVANQLVNKDVLLRKNQNGKITYKKKQQNTKASD
jgi:predicted transcriptional regulator